MQGRQSQAVREMVFAALFAAILCAVAPFSIPIGPVPLTFATMAIYLAAAALPLRTGLVSVSLYIALGAFGMPVFANFEGGLQKLAGASGGYIMGYLPCTAIAGVLINVLSNKHFARAGLSHAAGMAAGTVALYCCGTAWFMFQTGTSPGASVMLCVIPFIPGDAAKIAAASVISPRLRSFARLH